MIYGQRSDRELKQAKARAKTSEFFVTSDSISDIHLNSDELHYTSILTLSKYVNSRLSGTSNLQAYLADLQKTGSFYDAASNDKRNAPFTDGYWLLAMATYFLLGNYGSAKTSATKVQDSSFYGNRARTLHTLVSYLFEPDQPTPPELNTLVRYLNGSDVRKEEAIEEARSFLTDANPEDSFFSRILYVAISDTISHSTRALLPMYTGLDIEVWRTYLSTGALPKLLWQAQIKIGDAGVFSGRNAFIQLPTGSGKTKCIELILRSRFLAGNCKLAVVVAPLRALCSEIVHNLTLTLGDVAQVEQASDVMELDSWFTEKSRGLRVMVFTPEKLGFVMHHNFALFNDADLFVFDEAHLLDSESRGPGYELLLAEVFRAKPNSQKVLISAVVSNANEIAEWALGDPDLVVDGKDIQITEKSIGLIQHEGKKVCYVEQDNIFKKEYDVTVDINPSPLKRRNVDRKQRYFPQLDSKASDVTRDLAIYFANRIIFNGACAIYIPQRRSFPPLFKRLKELTDREADIAHLRRSIAYNDKEKLIRLIVAHYGKGNWITPGVDAGVLPHYGDLQGSIRQAVEYEFEHGDAKCIACTSTLAEGVNLPIKYLIVTGTSTGPGTPRTRDFQNLIGRAVRSGKYSEGSILVADDTTGSGKKRLYATLMRSANTEQCESAIVNLLADAHDNEWNPSKYISGERIVDAILNHLTDPQLEHKLAESFQEYLGCKEKYALLLASRRMRALTAIESYLSGAIVDSENEADIVGLCASTYAYMSSDDAKRFQLLKLFHAVHETLRIIPQNRTHLFHKMQLGARNSTMLINWVESSEGMLFLKNGCTDIFVLVRQFRRQNPNVATTISDEGLSAVIEHWIDGDDLMQIAAILNRKGASVAKSQVKVVDIERLVSRDVRFSFSHFVSCIIDAVDSNASVTTQHHLEILTALQRKVKYGVPSLRAAAICEEVIDDRMIAKDILSIIGATGSSDINVIKYEAISNQAKVEQLASELPTYCSKRILDWIGI